ncbi:hypothetical protein [Porphyromonas cangingivalis]|nr:hypothetical protein [Porphyromonas cangingivalis]
MKIMETFRQMNVQLVMAVIMSVVGLMLLIVALVMPPRGEIDSSVLVAFGEILTFVGAVFGIDYTHRVKGKQKGE